MTRFAGIVLGLLLLYPVALRADGPRDNQPDKVRPIPPPGITVPADRRSSIESHLAELEKAIDRLVARRDPRTKQLLPDVSVYAKAVRDALTHNEFFSMADLDRAEPLLRQGLERAGHLERGEAPWTTAKGLVVRGYVSRIDGSVQPYGLVIPASYRVDGKDRYRLDIWFHGRGETLSEVNFIDDRQRNTGLFTPEDTIVLHPYGRYCNAFKFAGEVDVLEALDAVRGSYQIDSDRISVRGFSMGGAACWQFAVHYADRWFAANPGAGFAETPRFLKVFQKESLEPTSYERRLWHLYDCTDYAANLLHCPTVAYSGEIDSQKQAADVMAEALRDRGIELVHIIGPGTAHSYHPAAKAEVERRLNSLAINGRERIPRRVTLETYTLKYNRMHWVVVDALAEHWTRARVLARLTDPNRIEVDTENVNALTLDFPAGFSPFSIASSVRLIVDGQQLSGPESIFSDRSWQCHLERVDGAWKITGAPTGSLRKRHDLQGPIDDAFMDAFVMVLPTGKYLNERVGAWVEAESRRAVTEWRRQFRGEPRVKKDHEITKDDIASAHLVLWGDPGGNRLLGQIAERLPIHWKRGAIEVGEDRYDSGHHAPVLIYPNPLNPNRYVVVNSGVTYREYDYLNNARQVPKLPDWAIIDIRTPPGPRYNGAIVAADFFDEAWKLRPRSKR